MTHGTRGSDACHNEKWKEAIAELEVVHYTANDLKRSLIGREKSRTYGVRFASESEVRGQIHVNPASRRASKGIVAPEHPSSLAKAEMFHTDKHVDPRFDIGCGSEGQSGAYSYEERLGI